MELEVFTTNVELQDIPSYTTNITVEGQLLKLSFMWNERIGKRTLYITDSADQCYLQNTILHPNEPFELNANAVLNDLPYSVTLIKTGDQKRVGNIFNWSKDFILCFSRTVDVEVEKLNVVYGVTNPSTPTIPPIVRPDQPYGAWILNQGYEIIGNDIKYTAYKTNSLNYYDSFALSNLVQALVKSFHDPDLQQYAAFTSAVEQLTNTVDWVLDPTNNQIRYNDPSIDPNDPTVQYLYKITLSEKLFPSLDLACQTALSIVSEDTRFTYVFTGTTENQCRFTQTNIYTGEVNTNTGVVYSRITNPSYDPEAEKEDKILPLETVAQKVISNAESSEDEVLKLLSEDYINLVAESISNADTYKQFVELEDLIPQLESNKVLRN